MIARTLALLTTLWCLLHAAEAAKPNILFLLTDDQSFETVRAFGHTDIDTPNLDRLVARGTTFTHAYNSGSWNPAVCVASRAMLITGRSLWKAKAVQSQLDAERDADRLWPNLMTTAGYRTYFAGKWHINTDAARCFDSVGQVRGGMPSDTPEAYHRPPVDGPDPWNPADPTWGGYWDGGTHWSEVTANEAIDFLSAREASEKPFFMYISFNAPHDPRQAPMEYLDRYPLNRIQLPSNLLATYPHKDAIGCGEDLRDEKLAPFPRTPDAVKVHRREYYALISHLDAQIGRILDALEASGQASNTWIFLTSDQGLAVGHHGLFGKQNLYDHSIRVPFIVVGPGTKANRKIATPVFLQDAMPTILEIADADIPDQVDFMSLLPLLKDNESAATRESLYFAYLDLQRAIVNDGWKLIVYPKAKVTKLYDLVADPDEMRDLMSDPDFTQRASDLFASLVSMAAEHGDPLKLRAIFPDL
jgi:arylsulfatase A-like enzyme